MIPKVNSAQDQASAVSPAAPGWSRGKRWQLACSILYVVLVVLVPLAIEPGTGALPKVGAFVALGSLLPLLSWPAWGRALGFWQFWLGVTLAFSDSSARVLAFFDAQVGVLATIGFLLVGLSVMSPSIATIKTRSIAWVWVLLLLLGTTNFVALQTFGFHAAGRERAVLLRLLAGGFGLLVLSALSQLTKQRRPNPGPQNAPAPQTRKWLPRLIQLTAIAMFLWLSWLGYNAR
jgi:hypothetical protein